MSRCPNPRRPESREAAPALAPSGHSAPGSFPGRALSFKLSLPLSSVGSCAGGRGTGVAGVRLASEMGCFHLSFRRCFSVCGHSGLHSGPARGESAVVRITMGSPPSTTGSAMLLAASGVTWGRQALLLAGLHPVHTKPLQQGGGSPPFSGQHPLADAAGALPKAPQPRCPGSPTAPLRRPSSLQGSPSLLGPLLGTTECWPRGWSVRVQAIPSPCVDMRTQN